MGSGEFADYLGNKAINACKSGLASNNAAAVHHVSLKVRLNDEGLMYFDGVRVGEESWPKTR